VASVYRGPGARRNAIVARMAKAKAKTSAAGLWLMKSEPEVFSIADLERDGTTTWEGVRNYTARNFMRDGMKLGDLVLYYHSNAAPSGIAGLARVSGLAEPDPTQFDPGSDYHDPGSSESDPRWLMVRLGFVERFSSLLSLDQLKSEAALSGMPLLQRGQRLSVQPVSAAHFAHVLGLASARTPLPSMT